MERPGKANSLPPSIEDCVVAVEEVESEDPVADIWGIHQPELALTGGILYICGNRELVGDVVHLERDVFK